LTYAIKADKRGWHVSNLPQAVGLTGVLAAHHTGGKAREDRSEVLWKLEHACVKGEMSEPETLVV